MQLCFTWFSLLQGLLTWLEKDHRCSAVIQIHYNPSKLSVFSRPLIHPSLSENQVASLWGISAWDTWCSDQPGTLQPRSGFHQGESESDHDCSLSVYAVKETWLWTDASRVWRPMKFHFDSVENCDVVGRIDVWSSWWEPQAPDPGERRRDEQLWSWIKEEWNDIIGASK